AKPDLLFGDGDRFTRLRDLGVNLGDRAFKLPAAFDQRLDEYRVGRAALPQQATGPRFFLDLLMQAVRVAAQPLCQGFQLGEKAAPLVKLPAVLAQNTIHNTHSAAPTAPAIPGDRYRIWPNNAKIRLSWPSPWRERSSTPRIIIY